MSGTNCNCANVVDSWEDLIITDDTGKEITCAVCLTEVSPIEKKTIILPCFNTHCFHVECLQKTAFCCKSYFCPCCKATYDPKLIGGHDHVISLFAGNSDNNDDDDDDHYDESDNSDDEYYGNVDNYDDDDIENDIDEYGCVIPFDTHDFLLDGRSYTDDDY